MHIGAVLVGRVDSVGRRTELIIIGEAMARAEEVDPDLANMISDVPGIVALRNQLVHNYPRIAPERIWEIITEHLPTLLSQVRTLLASS